MASFSLPTHAVFALLAVAVVACGGDVGSDGGASGAATGGSSTASAGGTMGAGGAMSLAGAGAASLAGASSVLPSQCTVPFVAGYVCDCCNPVVRYRFDSVTGGCVAAQYNGCQGGGGFFDLGVCQALCERRPSDASCPLHIVAEDPCSIEGALCSYNRQMCLCTILGDGDCLVSDPRCSKLGLNAKAVCTGEACTIRQDLALTPPQQVCTCTGGLWKCVNYY